MTHALGSADVLVIGGGLAGIMAALSAKDEGADVLLVTAGTFGKSGDSAIASGGLAIATNESEGDSVEAHLADTLASGKGLSSPAIARLVAHGGPAVLDQLAALGAEFARHSDGTPAFAAIPGHSFRRSVRCEGGGTSALLNPLVDAVSRRGVRVLEETLVVRLVHEEGSVRGAVVDDPVSRHRTRLFAPSTVLAAGGLGQLFLHTSNNPDIYGSGYALALEAGCSLVDLEFVQFTPTALVAPTFATGMSPGGALMAQPGVKLRNANGERFMPRYDPENAECTTRDELARAIHQEIAAGRGTEYGGVFLDLSETTRDQIADISGRFLRAMDAGGFDPFTQMVEVAPEAHFCMGGVPVTTNGETEIPGLFAAGETTVGLHGANRLNSNALTEAAVTGDVAGRSAAVRVRECVVSQGETSRDEGPADYERCDDEMSRSIVQLRRIVQEHGGVVRDADGLRDGLRQIEELSATVGDTTYGSRNGVVFAQMTLVARALLTAAQQRTESRGSHFRTDHPRTSSTPMHYRLRRSPDGAFDIDELAGGTTADVTAGALSDRLA